MHIESSYCSECVRCDYDANRRQNHMCFFLLFLCRFDLDGGWMVVATDNGKTAIKKWISYVVQFFFAFYLNRQVRTAFNIQRTTSLFPFSTTFLWILFATDVKVAHPAPHSKCICQSNRKIAWTFSSQQMFIFNIEIAKWEPRATISMKHAIFWDLWYELFKCVSLLLVSCMHWNDAAWIALYCFILITKNYFFRRGSSIFEWIIHWKLKCHCLINKFYSLKSAYVC